MFIMSLVLQSCEPVTHRSWDPCSSLRISILTIPLKIGRLTFKTWLFGYTQLPKSIFFSWKKNTMLRWLLISSLTISRYKSISMLAMWQKGCWVVAILGKTSMYDGTLGYRWCYHYWLRHHWWLTLSQWWTGCKNVRGSLILWQIHLYFSEWK